MKSYEFSLLVSGFLVGIGFQNLIEGRYSVFFFEVILAVINLFVWYRIRPKTPNKQLTLEQILFGKDHSINSRINDRTITFNGAGVNEEFPVGTGVVFRLFNRINDQQKEINALRTVHEEELKRLGDLCSSFASDKDKRMNKFDARLANLKNEIKADMRNEEIQAKAKKVVEKKEIKKVVKE